MQTFRKYLVYEYVPIMERTFRSGTRESCVVQRSIYVTLRGSEGPKRYINHWFIELNIKCLHTPRMFFRSLFIRIYHTHFSSFHECYIPCLSYVLEITTIKLHYLTLPYLTLPYLTLPYLTTWTTVINKRSILNICWSIIKY